MTASNKLYFSMFSVVFTFLLWFMLCEIGKAQEQKPPDYLKGGVISLKTKAGETKALSKDWAIVKRKNLSKYKVCPVCVEKVRTIYKDKPIVKYVRTKAKVKKNSLFLNLGYGSTGLEKYEEGEKDILIGPTYGPVFGATYIRRNSQISYGLSVLTNQTGSVLLGFDW